MTNNLDDFLEDLLNEVDEKVLRFKEEADEAQQKFFDAPSAKHNHRDSLMVDASRKLGVWHGARAIEAEILRRMR